ncbi:MAG: FtsW/RodA/SpoVE family cell cycle protein [Planctomycetaceae bacterium]
MATVSKSDHTKSFAREASRPGSLRDTREFRGLFVCLVSVLVGFGIVMVHSASITSWPTQFEEVYLSRHLTFLAIGVVTAMFCATIPARVWLTQAPLLLVGTSVLLLTVLIPGVGTRVNGAQRWLRFGGVSFQPSELAKIALPLMACRVILWRPTDRGWLKELVAVAIPLAMIIPLILPEPDLGTSAFLMMSYAIALFLAGWKLRYFVGCGVVVMPLLVSAVALRPYQMRRITGFIETWTNIDSAPWQLKQSLLTLGTGGLMGVGPGQGSQKLSYLPEANTDFVFAVVGEEFGLVGTLTIVFVWSGVFLTGVRLLASAPRIAKAVGTALLAQLTLQAAINVAVVTAMVPPKGIAHPLISYGGSNLVTSLATIGIILSMSRCSTSEEIDAVAGDESFQSAKPDDEQSNRDMIEVGVGADVDANAN